MGFSELVPSCKEAHGVYIFLKHHFPFPPFKKKNFLSYWEWFLKFRVFFIAKLGKIMKFKNILFFGVK